MKYALADAPTDTPQLSDLHDLMKTLIKNVSQNVEINSKHLITLASA